MIIRGMVFLPRLPDPEFVLVGCEDGEWPVVKRNSKWVDKNTGLDVVTVTYEELLEEQAKLESAT